MTRIFIGLLFTILLLFIAWERLTSPNLLQWSRLRTTVLSATLIGVFVLLFRRWFIDGREGKPGKKELAALPLLSKTMDAFVSEVLEVDTCDSSHQISYTSASGELRQCDFESILHRSSAFQHYLHTNYPETRRVFVLCDDPAAFTVVDIACMMRKIEIIAFPARAASLLSEAISPKFEREVIFCSSQAAQVLAVKCRTPVEVLVLDKRIPPRSFGAAYGSPVHIRFITEYFDGPVKRQSKKQESPTLRIEPSDVYTSLVDMLDDGSVSHQRVSHGEFLNMILSYRSELSEAAATGLLTDTPIAFLQQRALFYAMCSRQMDISFVQEESAGDLGNERCVRSISLRSALRLYEAAVTSAHGLWIFRKFPWIEKKAYCLFRRLHSFYYVLGKIYRGSCVLFPRAQTVFILSDVSVPANVFDLLEGFYGCPVVQREMRKLKTGMKNVKESGDLKESSTKWGTSDSLSLPGGIAISTAYLEAVYRTSPLVSDIFITNSPESKPVAVITPNREALACAMKRTDTPDWQEVQTTGKKLILESTRRLRRVFHLPQGCILRDVLLVAYSLSEHKGFRNAFGNYLRSAVTHFYDAALSNLDESDPNATQQFHAIPSELVRGSAQHSPLIRFPCAVDIGGTSCKIVFFEPTVKVDMPTYCIFERLSIAYDSASIQCGTWPLHERESAGTSRKQSILRCMRFPTEKLLHFIEFLEEKRFAIEAMPKRLPATGGGASRFQELITAKIGISLLVQSEFRAAVTGLNFLLETVPNEIVRYNVESDEARPVDPAEDRWPYLLVNVGSGISLVRCDSPAPGDFRRVSGSAIGGGTFWGLCRLITNATTWEEIDELTRVDGPGDAAVVDLLVRDIYGRDTALPGNLRPDTLASSFGRIASRGLRVAPKASDYVRSLLILMSNNITQIAYLWSQNLGIRNIYFCGGFLQNNPIVMRHIAQSMAYWTQESPVEAKFVRHNGYLGAIGGLLVE